MLDELRGKKATNDEGFLDHGYLPSFVHTNKARGYARSFGAQFNYQNHRFAGWAKTLPGFGKAFKDRVKAAYPAILDFTPYGEMLPNPGSYVDLDPGRVDKFGLPMARRHVRWGDNEQKLFNDMVQWSLKMLERAGAEILTVPAAPGHQPRARRLPYGRRPADFRREPGLPDARRQQPVCRRRQRLSLGVGEEPDPHHHGARGARRRSHRRPHEER